MEQIIKKTSYVIGYVITIFIFGCNSTWEEQIDYLLPKKNKLTVIETKESPIASLSTYRVEGDINLDSISSYPSQRELGERWVLKKWRTSYNENEMKNLIEMLEEVKCSTNCDDNDIYFNKELNGVIEGIENHDGFISYYFHPPDNNDPDYYNNLEFIEFYYLNKIEKKIFHISYGKF